MGKKNKLWEASGFGRREYCLRYTLGVCVSCGVHKRIIDVSFRAQFEDCIVIDQGRLPVGVSSVCISGSQLTEDFAIATAGYNV